MIKKYIDVIVFFIHSWALLRKRIIYFNSCLSNSERLIAWKITEASLEFYSESTCGFCVNSLYTQQGRLMGKSYFYYSLVF
ncbi:hypothetical protein VCRA2128O102_130037 [Vibrio crassostreae]|nr:hypothetical protein VCRA2113O222_110043 [Vibrio crassostreae]CAK1714972.1 hypothetical protein VCRA2119O245_110073 [Vibrio crassostreae]CAK1744996.1 hypothetical protein VCRA2113O201_130073 [Vibrio crassostreae]CAK1745651.1 hypothetical protein VCRA2113O197_130044 [Vibrio crassostreae]CAK1754404.1 hypothetical protein VCRA2113O206_140051 [Vibrio crassostreae]